MLGPMKSLEDLVDLYCEAWSTSSASEREQLVRETLTADATYCDPRTEPMPLDGLLAHIAKIQSERPGARVVRTSNIDIHHNFARFHWCVMLPDGTRLPEGIDVIELSSDGQRIQRIIGFFGPLKARSA